MLDKPDEEIKETRSVKDVYKNKTNNPLNKDKKLTNWKNEPTIDKLKLDYTNAQSSHSMQTAKIDSWLDNLNITGSAKLPKAKNKSMVQPQLIRKQAEWRYAALSEPFLSTPDLFELSPVSHEDRKAAHQNGLVLNNQFQTKLDKVKFIDEYVRSAVNEGVAIVRLGWCFKEEEVEEEVPQFVYTPVGEEQQEQYAQMLEQVAAMEESAPDSFATQEDELKEAVRIMNEEGQLVLVEVEDYVTEKVMKTKVNKPELTVCDYRSVIIDPTCQGDLDKASFLIYSFVSSHAELKADGKYKNLEKLKENNESALALPDDYNDHNYSNDFSFSDVPRQKLMVYEYWGYYDIHDDGIVVPIVATWVGGQLIRMEENPFPDGGIPFVVVPYLPVKGSLYGEPDGVLLEDHQKIIGAVTRGMIDLLGKSANSQTGMPKNMLDSTNKTKFEAGQDYMYNPQSGLNPQTHVYQHKYPEIPNSALTMLGHINADAESLIGVKAFSQGGISGNGLGDTAASVRGALDAASKREMGILRRLSNGIIKIGRKIIAMNAEFLEEEEIVRITNEQFVKIRKDDLAGNFDLKLTISTAEADNAKAQELAFMLQTMGNTLPPEMGNILLSEIAKLRNMPDLARTIEEYQPQPDPMQEEIQQLTIEKLKAEIELLKAEAQERGTKGMVNESKVPVEAARAAKLQNEADNKSLDFVQNEDGTKHQRELEREQQRGLNQLDNMVKSREMEADNNLLSKSVDALLNPKPTNNF